MNHHYRDITDQLGDKPPWWDEHAVPRYCDFSPDATADIYCREVCLLGIECQGCGEPFKVCMSMGTSPSGPTMNSVPRRVIEFWRKGERFEWVRAPELEVAIDCDWAEAS